jgi:hypothetical protein
MEHAMIEPGYYWVKFFDGKWTIVSLDEDGWVTLFGNDTPFREGDLPIKQFGEPWGHRLEPPK